MKVSDIKGKWIAVASVPLVAAGLVPLVRRLRRSSNGKSPKLSSGSKPGAGAPYNEWTYDELYDRAQELDIEGRSTMNKDELITALRNA